MSDSHLIYKRWAVSLGQINRIAWLKAVGGVKRKRCGMKRNYLFIGVDCNKSNNKRSGLSKKVIDW